MPVRAWEARKTLTEAYRRFYAPWRERSELQAVMPHGAAQRAPAKPGFGFSHWPARFFHVFPVPGMAGSAQPCWRSRLEVLLVL
ncbi:hypothetical protein G5632_23255 [Escherichia coli]|nr:hypothetical protein [Escherichia coli]